MKCFYRFFSLARSFINHLLIEINPRNFFQKEPPEVFYEEGVFKISQNSQEKRGSGTGVFL